MNVAQALPKIAIIGGTGKEGKGLAYRWSRAGYEVIIGSRSLEKAAVSANEIRKLVGGECNITGDGNLEAATRAAVVVLTVPFDAHNSVLLSIKPAMKAKLLIDATVPLFAGSPAAIHLPPAGSAAQEAREILTEGTEISAAFHTISHQHFFQDEPIDCDVLVTGTSPAARTQTLQLVAAAGLRGWDAGALENSAVSEGMTSVLIHINKTYGSRNAGIRVTGVKHQ